MRKELEYAKKITLIAKLYRMNLLSEKEFEKIRRKLMDSYLVSGERSDDPVDRKSTRLNSSHDRQSRMPSSA